MLELLAGYLCLTAELFVIFCRKGTNVLTGEEVAIKLEVCHTDHPQLYIEGKFYRMLQGGGRRYCCGFCYECYCSLG